MAASLAKKIATRGAASSALRYAKNLNPAMARLSDMVVGKSSIIYNGSAIIVLFSWWYEFETDLPSACPVGRLSLSIAACYTTVVPLKYLLTA